MKSAILIIITLYAASVFAADVCVIQEADEQFTVQCTVQQDSVETYSGFGVEYLGREKAKQIKVLLEKGYSLKSENVFLKD
ncbi:MAG: hypothetical protein HOO06_05735 [Bdellovibrionaceae bacterium]|nr:hypothetical protein [Pseudobdellovibrionaceae bacterium]